MPVIYSKKAVMGKVVIDKISVVLDVEDKQQSTIEHNLKSLLEHYGVKIQRPRYKFCTRLYLHHPDIYVEVLINPKHPTFPFLRVELNPANGYLGDFAMLMDLLLPAGYAQLIEGGRCTRIDAAVDIVGININQLLITYPNIRKTKGYYKDGGLETYTLGGKQGETEICIYDKAAQIRHLNAKKEMNLEVPTEDITRVEVRKKKHYPLKDLATLPNFFEGVLLASFPDLPLLPATKEHVMLFLEVCRSKGAQDALMMLQDSTRQKYRNWLQNTKLPWWEPQVIWEGWQHPANALLHPKHVGE